MLVNVCIKDMNGATPMLTVLIRCYFQSTDKMPSGDCLPDAILQQMDSAPEAFTPTHLRRMAAVFMIRNAETLFPLLKDDIMMLYGFIPE